MRNKSFQSAAPMWAALALGVLWFSALLASGYEEGMTAFDLIAGFNGLMEHPFAIRWTPHTLKFMFFGLLVYAMGVAYYYASRENRRPGEEYGSARWGSAWELNRKYRDKKNKAMNIPLTLRVRIGLDGYIHQRNLNILVVGGSGTGKTQSVGIPEVASANSSYIITDPKGELLRSTGQLLRDAGYDVKVFDLVHPEQSDCYSFSNGFGAVRVDIENTVSDAQGEKMGLIDANGMLVVPAEFDELSCVNEVGSFLAKENGIWHIEKFVSDIDESIINK